MRLATLLLSAAVIPAFAQDVPQASTIGATREQSIEVCKPPGERAYLARLVCPDNSHPSFERIGSVGERNDMPANMSEDDQMELMVAAMEFEKPKPGDTDYHIVDAYSVQCGATTTTLYLDMYHCDAPAPDTAPDGFTIIK